LSCNAAQEESGGANLRNNPQAEGCEILAQADPHRAPAARSTGASCSRRTTAQHRPQLQRQSGDDFEAAGVNTFRPAFEDDDERTLLEKVEKLQAGFIGFATQDGGDIDRATYERLRMELLGDATTRARLPDFVRKCRDQGQFWQFIRPRTPTNSAARSVGGNGST
jgi:hypothetical protein